MGELLVTWADLPTSCICLWSGPCSMSSRDPVTPAVPQARMSWLGVASGPGGQVGGTWGSPTPSLLQLDSFATKVHPLTMAAPLPYY